MRAILQKKHQKKAECQICRDGLIHSDGDVPLDVIEARQYKRGNLQKPGSYLYYITGKALEILFSTIPKVCNVNNISAVLVNLLVNTLDFVPFNCSAHEMGKIIANLIVFTVLHFWCKQVNKLLSGKDYKFFKKKPSAADKIKVEAHNMYVKKLKYKNSLRKK